MKKKELIKIISGKTGLKKKVCKSFLENVFERIPGLLSENKYVHIENFGEFKILRKRTEVKLNRENIKTVIPPEDYIDFRYTGNSEVTGADVMNIRNLSGIIRDVSEAGNISIDSAGKIFYGIFETMKDCFDKKKSVEISSFGIFHLRNKSVTGTGKETKIVFIPSEKVSRKVNYNFSNLQTYICSVSSDDNISGKNEFEFKISEDFKKAYRENADNENEFIYEESETAESIETGFGKKLISTELIKLHKEITEQKRNTQN